MRRVIEGGWGAAPVEASALEREGGGKSGDGGPFAACLGLGELVGWPRALQALHSAGCAVASAPGGHTAQPGGRAKRGLDLFLGQNRTKGEIGCRK